MTKQIKLTKHTKKHIKIEQTKSLICIGGAFLIGAIIVPEVALATTFNLDAGAQAILNPLRALIRDYWLTVVGISAASSGIFFGEGDLKQKAIKAAIGGSLAGGVMMAIQAMGAFGAGTPTS